MGLQIANPNFERIDITYSQEGMINALPLLINSFPLT